MRPVTIKAFVRLNGEERRMGAIWIQDPPVDWEGHHLEVRLVNHSLPSRGDAVIITVEEEDDR